MFALPIFRQFATAAIRLPRPSFSTYGTDACDTNVTAVDCGAAPNDPNIGRYSTGCGVGMEALASPITLQAMNPPLTIISGFTPKKAGFQSTRSASLPGSMDPTCAAMPCVMAGLMVYLATKRFTLKLSLRLESCGSGPR